MRTRLHFTFHGESIAFTDDCLAPSVNEYIMINDVQYYVSSLRHVIRTSAQSVEFHTIEVILKKN